jgi:hypothetical protein
VASANLSSIDFVLLLTRKVKTEVSIIFPLKNTLYTLYTNRAECTNENAPQKAGHYLNLGGRGGIEPPTEGFSTLSPRLNSR